MSGSAASDAGVPADRLSGFVSQFSGPTGWRGHLAGLFMARLMRPTSIASLATILLLLSGCASWKKFAYEGFDRDSWQQPERVIAALGVQSGERIADVGAGGGYFTFRFAEAVGRDGLVYAVDIDPDMIGYLRDRVQKEKLTNVDVVAATPDDPGIPQASVDLLFTSNTYHHFDDPVAYFRQAKQTLRPGGRVAVLDLNDSGWFAWLFGHHTLPAKLRSEMEAAGYRLSAEHDFVAEQTFLVFVPATS